MTNWEEHWKLQKLNRKSLTTFGAESTTVVTAPSTGIPTSTAALLVIGAIFVGTLYGEKFLDRLSGKSVNQSQ